MRMSSLLVLSVLLAGAASAQAGERPQALFERADANDDGLVAREEFLTARAQLFGSRDRNDDGFIDKADRGERGAGRPRIGQAMNAMTAEFDTDGDGKVGKVEFVEGGGKLFDRADTDQSGTLDKSELDAAKAKVRGAAKR